MATRIFISHAGGDAKLAKALIDLIEAGLEVPNGTIRCTSVDGYKLEGGDDGPEVLRANLNDSAIVLGMLTKTSVSSSYVLMELGAAWAFKTRAIPLIGPGATFVDLPGPFKDIHALKMVHEADMSSLIATIARETGFAETKNMPKIVAALKAISEIIAGSGAPGVTPPLPFVPDPTTPAMASVATAPAAPAPVMHDDEARVLLESWLSDLAEKVHSHKARSPQIIPPADIATQAGVPEAKVAPLLAGVAYENQHFGVSVKPLQGGKIHLDIGPARVRQVRGRGFGSDGWE